MTKSVLFSLLSIALISVALPRAAFAAGGDVFIDEGDGDFDSAPAVTAQASPAKNEARDNAQSAESKKKKKKKKGHRATASVEELKAHAADAELADTGAAATAPAKQDAAPKAENKPAKENSQPSPKSHRKTRVASAAHSPGEFVVTKSACPMLRAPASDAAPIATTNAGRKIWVEKVDATWVRGFNKSGQPGYISRDCVK